MINKIVEILEKCDRENHKKFPDSPWMVRKKVAGEVMKEIEKEAKKYWKHFSNKPLDPCKGCSMLGEFIAYLKEGE